MKMLKKGNALVLGLAVLLALGCGDKEKKEDPTPVNQVQKDCLLTRETTFQGSITEYNYNSSGRLESIDFIANGWKHHAYEMSYNADGNISEARFLQPFTNLNDQKTIYTYNADKLLVTKTKLMLVNNVWEKREIFDYKYNAAKQLIKERYYVGLDTTTLNYSLFSYPAPGQVIVAFYTKDTSGNFSSGSKTHYYYDNKNHYASSLGYFRFPEDKGYLLKHNVISSTTVYLNGTNTNNTTYNYNVDGYPAQNVNPATGAVYANYEYGCQ